jgi:NADPH:quinone reductase-like Zn-dependent oxidoreductase
MRAAIVTEYSRTPEVGERPEPEPREGHALLELRAAAINPADLAVASGTFPFGSPPMPYVPGLEGVATVLRSSRFAEGTVVFGSGRGLGIGFDGTLSERFTAPEEILAEVPSGADDQLAASFGVAGLAGWMPLSIVAPVRSGESVLILGATGSLGSVAIQAAKLLGAGRVVAVGRNVARLERARSLGADDTVELGDGFAERLADVVREAPPTLIVDALWGPAVEAAVAVAAPAARVLHLGASAGPTATLPSGLVRGKQLQLIGYSNFGMAPDVVGRSYQELVGHAMAGHITIESATLPLARVGEAWELVGGGAGLKQIIVP